MSGHLSAEGSSTSSSAAVQDGLGLRPSKQRGGTSAMSARQSEATDTHSSSSSSSSDNRSSGVPEESTSSTSELHLRRDWYSTAATFMAGGIAGAASRTLTAPLDRVKVIVQEGHLVRAPDGGKIKRFRNVNLLEVARVIRADGGWKGFWRGNMVNCFKAGPEFAIVFTLRRYLTSLHDDRVQAENARINAATIRYDESEALHWKETQESGEAGEEGRYVAAETPQERARHQAERQRTIDTEAAVMELPFRHNLRLSKIPMLVVNCTIGAVSGLGAQALVYPMELVKTRVCVARSSEFTGLREVICSAYHAGGIKEFYRGFAPNMVGIVVYRGLEMGLYSSMQQSIMLYRMRWQNLSRHDAALSAAEVGMVGMAASIVAQTVSYPLNVVRTRLQTQGTNGRVHKYSGMVDCFVKIIREKGVPALFGGLTANYLKAVPASAVTFIVFEKTQQLLLGDD